jgi:hypothetical protein
LRQKDHKFQDNLGYVVRPYLQKKKKKKKTLKKKKMKRTLPPKDNKIPRL